MALPEPQPSLVIRYSYLWWDEARRGQEEGRKNRPAVIVLTIVEDSGDKRVLVVPVTHTQPDDPSHGVEIPAATKKRLGLDDERSWIVTTELNRFVWPGPDIRATGKAPPDDFAYGLLPAALFAKITEQLRTNVSLAATRTVARSE